MIRPLGPEDQRAQTLPLALANNSEERFPACFYPDLTISKKVHQHFNHEEKSQREMLQAPHDFGDVAYLPF